MSHQKHLAKYMHDVVNSITEVWCEGPFTSMTATEDIDEATCLACLWEAHRYGTAALDRVNALAPGGRYRVRIGDDVYEFPPGTTKEHAESVLAEAKARCLAQLAATPKSE